MSDEQKKTWHERFEQHAGLASFCQWGSAAIHHALSHQRRNCGLFGGRAKGDHRRRSRTERFPVPQFAPVASFTSSSGFGLVNLNRS
ncbi:hypothetical protein C8F04DRAFT_1399468 [Mycena alexandri]|uniref:Uncharacterized protein n=1 Tax=Mycena alexandri TaxID=1745969 RepID=A0AAD6SGG6_9AGAR|nr:hypothetical protein C8F04DRAFT_1399468 [Mycena alexandri]